MIKKYQNWGYLFIAPYFIGFFVFTMFSVIFSIGISFTDYNILTSPTFVGLKNFRLVWGTAEIWIAFRNVFTYAVLLQLIEFPLAFAISLLLNQKIKGIGIFRVTYYLPVLTPSIAVSIIWMNIYNPQYGVLNWLLSYLGLGPFNYLTSTIWYEAIIAVVVMTVWHSVGSTTLYILAALQNISTDVIEAAVIDGATGFKKFIHITLPLLTPTLFFLSTVSLIGAMQVFDIFYITGNESMRVPGLLMYNYTWSYSRVGVGSAIAWTMFLVTGIMTFIQKKMEKRWVHYA